MSLFPEQLFSLPLLKDIKTQQLEHVFRNFVVSGVGTADVTRELFITPNDRFFVIASWAVTAFPSASSLSAGMVEASGFGVNTAPICGIASGLLGSATRQVVSGIGPIWVPPGFQLQGRAIYSTGAIGNFTTFHLSGFTIPRGNISRS